MTTYRTIISPIDGRERTDFVLRSDGAFIPADPRNADWQAYQAWLDTGNSPDAPATETESTKSNPV